MLLESLLQVVEKLRNRIQTHGDKLRQSEALTRSALVDPLLRALGWDTEDPELVIPEYQLKVAVGNRGSADYALMHGDQPIIMMEAKKLGTDLSSVVGQGINYCTMNGVPYLVCTNGRKWDVYGLLLPGDITKKKITALDVMDDPSDVCLDALALWRRSVQNGAVRKAQTPVIEPSASQVTPSGQSPVPAVPEPAPPTPAVNRPAPEGNWIPLSKLQPEKGDTPPLEIQFPGGSTAPVKFWADIPVAVVRWLDQQGRLDETRLPVRSGKRHILSSSPIHPTGTAFKSPKAAGEFYVETAGYWNSYQVKNARIIIERAGKGAAPTDFSVRLP